MTPPPPSLAARRSLCSQMAGESSARDRAAQQHCCMDCFAWQRARSPQAGCPTQLPCKVPILGSMRREAATQQRPATCKESMISMAPTCTVARSCAGWRRGMCSTPSRPRRTAPSASCWAGSSGSECSMLLATRPRRCATAGRLRSGGSRVACCCYELLLSSASTRSRGRNTQLSGPVSLHSLSCRWLETVLAASSAPVKVIASGSVLFGSSPLDNNTAENQWQGRCSGGGATRQGRGLGLPRCSLAMRPFDLCLASFPSPFGCHTPSATAKQVPPASSADDWDCYRPAQLNLLHTLQRHAAATKGCYIVITGDYHYSDIKVAKPGAGQTYTAAYQTAKWSTPIYQVVRCKPCWIFGTFGGHMLHAGRCPRTSLLHLQPGQSNNVLTDTFLRLLSARWRAA